AVCEAMMIGMPVVGLATTEMVSVIRDGYSGFLDTDPEKLIAKMRLLLNDRELARQLGEEGRKVAMQRFSIERFVNDWLMLFEHVTRHKAHGPAREVVDMLTR
ncbi:MAG TPA: glycosyltransferase, partial [Ohtaekwangia sp.]|nr:glycosyltransferase [Ohtaekwangia sp.]